MKAKIKMILSELKSMARPDGLQFMAKYGINTDQCYGVPMPEIRKLGKVIGKDHELALDLWGTGINDARILATLVAEVDKVTKPQMNSWVKDFNS